MLKYNTIVAVSDNTLIGFGDITNEGYLDKLYVSPFYQRHGVATAICELLESYVKDLGVETINVHSSITALSFFLNRNYFTITDNLVTRNDIILLNYLMSKNISNIK